MSNFDTKVVDRIKRLEREVERLRVKERPAGGGGVTDHGALTGLADNDHPQYRLTADAIDHGALGGLADNDHPQYLLTTGKAADSDKLDGVDSTGFATAGHDHSGVYLPLAGKAADADKLDGNDSTGFVQTSGNQTVGGIKTFSSIPVLPSSDPTTANQAVRKGYADATYLGISEKASGLDVGTGTNDTKFVTPLALQSAFGITAAGKALIDDATVSDQRNTLKLKLTALAAMSDNTATSFTPTNSSGFFLLRIAILTGAGSFALLSYDAISPTAYATLMIGSANIAVTTGALAGTTGTDGKLTISAHTDGKIYVENRLGGTAYIGYLAL